MPPALVIFDDAPLFDETAAQLPLPGARHYWGTCPVCDLVSAMVVGAPPVCGLCREQPERSRAHVAQLRAAALRRQLLTDHAGELALIERRLARFDRADAALDALGVPR